MEERLNQFTKEYKKSKIYQLLDNTSKYFELKNIGVLEKRNLNCEVLTKFPDGTYQCNIDNVNIKLDWFGCYNKQYFELVVVSSDSDYFITKSVQAWQGAIMRELSVQSIKTFVFVYFKPSNRLVALTNDNIKTLVKKFDWDPIPVGSAAEVGIELSWDSRGILDLSELFKD